MYAGDFLEDATVYIPFNTFDSNDPSASVTITDLASSDVEIWKNGVIQTTPGAGVSITLNIGTNNGTHLIAVDTSNTTDGGFYVISADYQVRVNGTTIDGATVNAWVGSFSIENRFKEVTVTSMSAGVIANATFNANVGSTGHATNIIALAVRKILEELNLDHLLKVDTSVVADGDLEDYVVEGTVLAHLMSANKDVTGFKCTTDSLEAIKVFADTIKAETATIVTHTGTTIPATITTAQNDLDTITGGSGVLIDTDAVSADALNADAVTEIWSKAMVDLATGAPSATASVLVAINYLYEALRNKTLTTATLISIKKDDGTTDLMKSTISDATGTFTKNEFVSG